MVISIIFIIIFLQDAPEMTRDNVLVSAANRLLQTFNVTLDPKLFPPKKYQLTAEFSRDKCYLYV